MGGDRGLLIGVEDCGQREVCDTVILYCLPTIQSLDCVACKTHDQAATHTTSEGRPVHQHHTLNRLPIFTADREEELTCCTYRNQHSSMNHRYERLPLPCGHPGPNRLTTLRDRQ